MTAYTLSIVTPQGEIFNGLVNSLTAPGEMGRVGILGSHAAMIMALKRGMMKVETQQDGQKFFTTDHGILEVKPSHDVLVLVEGAEAAADHDEAAEI
jgi:F-type H+-transporting ATPase subunit epsilon